MSLPMGANTSISNPNTIVYIEFPAGSNIDITALQIYAGGKVRGDNDMCFYNQPSISDGAVKFEQSNSGATFNLNLSGIPEEAEKIVFTATTDDANPFSALNGRLALSLDATHIEISCADREERALILAEIYKRNGAWKVRHVGQGFNGGLQAIAEHFGIEVAAPSEAPVSMPNPVPKPATPPKINLSKVSLTKNESRISLKKENGRYGKIRVNLNWNQKKKSSGIFGMGKRGIDLDVGAFVEGTDGSVTAVQALGNTFGNYSSFPYTFLHGDDRTGAATDGEWLEINGEQWNKLRRVLVYAFIYEGAPDWRETDGAIRILVPDQPEIEVRMNEHGSRDGMCAVALLENVGGQVQVNREVQFFKGHRQMDDAYGWGMRWVSGRK
ncbi:General stress protein 16U [Pseudovibrio sp. W64]|uniref:TerD family protein n=1 Tax=Pseudovibrio sp. W64 TaxID=1735583 RepID=UPI0007B280BE|nr:TerD family protein [Pseudovibrio sp. W64]KZK79079.1 General stress protein 16U [Pseudovibrio sp. W64]